MIFEKMFKTKVLQKISNIYGEFKLEPRTFTFLRLNPKHFGLYSNEWFNNLFDLLNIQFQKC